MGRLSGGPWRQGVAVTSMIGFPGASSRVVAHGWRPRALPPSRLAPAAVVRTTPAAGSRARPAVSRLSPWWSWLSSTASTGPRSAAATAGPVSFRELEPQPKVYRRPAGSKVGSVSSRHPPTSISAVGPPMWVMRTSTGPQYAERATPRDLRARLGLDSVGAARAEPQLRSARRVGARGADRGAARAAAACTGRGQATARDLDVSIEVEDPR